MEDGGGGAGLGERPDSFLCLLLCRLLESPSGQGARSAHRAAGGSPGRDPPGPPPRWDGRGPGGTGRWGRSWSRWGRGDIGPGRVLEQVPVPQRHGIPLRVGVLSRVQVPVAVLERCRQLRGGREGLGRGGCGSAGDGGASCIPGGSVGPGGRGGAGTLHPGAVGRGWSAGGWGEDLSVGRERGSRDKIWDGWGVMESTGRAQAVWLLGRRL